MGIMCNFMVDRGVLRSEKCEGINIYYGNFKPSLVELYCSFNAASNKFILFT